MRHNEAEYETDTHTCQGERAVDAVCTHHLRIVIVDPKERVEEQIFGRGGVLRDAVAEAVQGLQPVHLQFYGRYRSLTDRVIAGVVPCGQGNIGAEKVETYFCQSVRAADPLDSELHALKIGAACDHAAAEQSAEIQYVFNGRCWYLWGVLVWLIVKNVTSLTILKHYDFI